MTGNSPPGDSPQRLPEKETDSSAERAFPLAPVETRSLAEHQARDRFPPPPDAPDPYQTPPPPGLRYTVRDLLLTVTFICVGLGGARWLEGYFAGAVGLLAFVGLLMVGLLRPKGGWVGVTIWAAIAIYFGAAFGAILANLTGGLNAPLPPP